jgi:hypothetical protein
MEIELVNGNAIIEMLNKYPQIAEGLFDSAIKKSILTIQRDAIKNAPSNTGQLRASIQSGFEPMVGMLEVLANYGSPIEFGARAHFPPIEEIKRWCKLRFGTDTMAYAIAKSMAQKGMKAQPFLEPAVAKNENAVNEYFDKALRELVNQLIIQ